MKYFSMFSGIGGFELGIHNAFLRFKGQGKTTETPTRDSQGLSKQLSELSMEGLSCIGYSEIDKYAIKVYERRFNGNQESGEYISERTRGGEHLRPIGNKSDNQVQRTETEQEECLSKDNSRRHKNYGNATTINPDELPDFDLLVGGFPCQAFSIAGKRKGFDDTRGTLFFDIARILENKRPRHLVLENVKGLLSHDSGKTFQTILGVLSDLGYRVEWQILNSKDFGVPQNRERIFIIGHLRGECGRKVLPISGQNTTTLRQNTKAIAQHNNRRIATITDTVNTLSSTFRGNPDGDGRPAILQINQPTHSNDRVYATDGISPTLNTMQGGNRQPFIKQLNNPKHSQQRVYDPQGISPTIAAGNLGGGKSPSKIYQEPRIRRLTPKECERLQGFPDDWTAGESDTQRYKMCGNAVTVNVIEAIMTNLVECLYE